MFIRSERLFLRPGWPEDWSEIFAQIADEQVVRNLAQVPWPYTAEAAQQFAGLEQDARCPHFLVTLPGGDGAQVVGSVSLIRTPAGAEMGYWIGRDHWGRGYATEATRALLRFAPTLGHRDIKASHFIDNPASGRVLRKLGFRPTGRVERRYSLARGTMAPAAIHAISLTEPADCDGGDDAMCGKRVA